MERPIGINHVVTADKFCLCNTRLDSVRGLRPQMWRGDVTNREHDGVMV